jgi:hypothetical protein
MSEPHQHRCANYAHCRNYYDCTDPECLTEEPKIPGLCLPCYQESFGRRTGLRETGVLRFLPGRLVATRGAIEAFYASGDFPLEYLLRHLKGDWGEVDEHDRLENELSVRQGWRILSVYTLTNGTKVWVITEADRSVTTFLLPDEY